MWGCVVADRIVASSVLLMVVSGLAACGASTRMPLETSAERLAERKRGVAVMQFEMPNETCSMNYMWIGTREGEGHRLVRMLYAKGSPSPTTANAAEIELESGEYQVLGFLCKRPRSVVTFGSQGGPQTASYASFTVRSGEIVNVGRISFRAVQGTRDIKAEVGDWSLEDLKRYRDERPTLYAGMQTRLMTLKLGVPLVGRELDERCADLKVMQASGKLQQLPKGCA